MATIEEIKELAIKRNGQCLSEVFEGWKYKLKWQCEEGHTWEANLSNVKYGKWCPMCAKKSRGLKRRDTIENMDQIANGRGGKCLSNVYESDRKHLEWQCKEGHTWNATPSNIKRGKWCPICSRKNNGLRRRKTIEDMEFLAKKHGGKCISTEYFNMSIHLEWECKLGHRWSALPSNISRGKWCPYCSGRYRTIEEMKTLANSKGGECLSPVFFDMKTKLKWQCGDGHVWESTPNSILNSDTWCPICAGNLIKTIEWCKEIAEEKNGICISKKYKGIDSKLKWKCSKGHIFHLTPGSVDNGVWCPRCNENILNLHESKCRFILEELLKVDFYKDRKIIGGNLELDGYNENLKLAFEYNGEQHYHYMDYFHKDEEDFIGQQNRDKVKQEKCKKKGIKLIVIPYTVNTDKEKEIFIRKQLNEYSIPIINEIVDWKIFYKYYNPLDELIEIASSKNGVLLDLEYNGVDGKLKWRCHEGHIWSASPYQVKKGSWCPRCSGRTITIEDMYELASNQGGRCLSDKYINNSTKLKWECSKGHTWLAVPAAIKSGTWCPECNGNPTYTIEDMQRIAKKRNGKCLSLVYENISSKLLWECGRKHKWEAVPGSILSGTWCRKCLLPSIEDAKKLASQFNGECLSEEYIDSTTKLHWKCKRGHDWFAILGDVKRNRWCPECKKELNKERKLKELREIARSKNGECLSEFYENVDAKMKWQCIEGHQWQTSAYSIKNGAWCPRCVSKTINQDKKLSIEEMQQIAKDRGGKCISTEYINNHTKLKWECAEGHQWKSTPKSVKNGTWCKSCRTKQAADRQRKSIDDMHELAAKRNGKCLSSTYVNAHTKLLWECLEGHQWEAKPNNIQQGKWCPQCRKKKS